MRGRKNKPYPMRVIEGKAKKGDPKPAQYSSNNLTCPRWLTPEAKKEWRRLAPSMKRIGVLTIADRATFITYCENYGRAERISRKLRDLTEAAGESALLVKTPNGAIQQNPLLSILNRATDLMHKAALELGLTPASRTRIATQAITETESHNPKRQGILDP